MRHELKQRVPEISKVMDKMLQKSPDDRFQTGAEVARALPACLKKYIKK